MMSYTVAYNSLPFLNVSSQQQTHIIVGFCVMLLPKLAFLNILWKHIFAVIVTISAVTLETENWSPSLLTK